ncbi:hypothetical protein IAR55_002135 [Kwoniella newhampshirensis]|uniref:Maintenance of mitochondrial morphology protein 1 n=1 Tax=Kwoniella newhampshirensis TaxID=1651941 RepID=A0AAW0YYN7_9TREE
MSVPTLAPPPPTPPPSSPWTFTQGLILGQASFLVIVLLFVRYVVFSPSEETNAEGWKRRRAERAKRTVLSTTSVPPPPATQLLGKTSYEMATHPAESTDWLNVLFAQILQGYRNDLLSAGGEEGARQRIENWLNPAGSKLSWLDPIEVTSLSLGNAYPLLSNARIRPADGRGRIRAEIDVDYLDSISLSLSTAVLVNFPRPRFAVLPVSLGVELVSIGGTMSVQLHELLEDRQHLHACLLPDFHLNLKTTSLLGSRAKLQDIPKLEQLILSRLRAVIQDRFVHPNHLSLALPRILSPSVSPTPILNDIGDAAVNAMSEAMTSGISKMVEDFIGPSAVSQEDDEEYMQEAQDIPLESSMAHLPTSPTRSQKRIPMPANFPSSYAASSSNTPLQTPGLAKAQHPKMSRRQTQQQQPPPSYTPQHQNQSHQRRPSMTATASSSYRPGPASSLAPSQSQSQFRFRGHFASNPGTPGGQGLGINHESGMDGNGARRVGALNSRAT